MGHKARAKLESHSRIYLKISNVTEETPYPMCAWRRDLHVKLRQTNSLACRLEVESDKWQGEVKMEAADTCIIIVFQ